MQKIQSKRSLHMLVPNRWLSFLLFAIVAGRKYFMRKRRAHSHKHTCTCIFLSLLHFTSSFKRLLFILVHHCSLHVIFYQRFTSRWEWQTMAKIKGKKREAKQKIKWNEINSFFYLFFSSSSILPNWCEPHSISNRMGIYVFLSILTSKLQ